MRILISCLLLIFSTTCVAGDRTEKVRALTEAQGLVQMFEQQLEAGKLQGRQQAQRILDQFMAQLKPTKEFEARFRSAAQDFHNSLENSWSAQEIVEVWAKAYGSYFTDQELDQLVLYYTSPLGKKDVLSSQEAMPELNNHFVSLSKPIIERATNDFIQRLQLIAKECRCRK